LNGANNNGVALACKVRKGLDVSFAARLFNLLLFKAFIAALLRSGSQPATYLHHMLYAGAGFGGFPPVRGTSLPTPISFFLIFPSIS